MTSDTKQKSILEKKKCDLSFRNTMEWAGITSQAELDEMSVKVMERYRNGDFFMERIGRYREVDISLALTVMGLRTQWIAEAEIKTVQEFMLLDMAFIAYFHFIRLNEMINNLMANIEWDVFALDAPQFKGNAPYDTKKNKLTAEALAWRIREVLEPVLEQYNRMFTRNVKTLKDLKRNNVFLMNIGGIDQVNIGDKQINQVKTNNA